MLLIIITSFYAIIISGFLLAWICNDIKYNDEKITAPQKLSANSDKSKPEISVVITVRNEQENIASCLDSLLKQNTGNYNIEIVISDDCSQDGTVDIIKDYQNNKLFSDIMNIRLIENSSCLKDNGSKKVSQKAGIQSAKGEIIILTDADCSYENKWLATIYEEFRNKNVQFVSGPVSMLYDTSPWEQIQSLEFSSLIISGGASIMLHKPVMSNGANLAFRKSGYEIIADEIPNEKISSGDDVFLMDAFNKAFGPASIHFLKNKNAIVYTKPSKTFKAFIFQRIRWVSKAGSYKNLFQILLSLLVFVTNAAILASLFLYLISAFPINSLIFIAGIKAIADFMLLYMGLSFFNNKKLLWWFIPMQILYPIYIVSVSIAALFVKSEWKGRPVIKGIF